MSSVSIVVPIYRDPAASRRCIASIAAQSRVPDEVVLVDDCGPDGAYEAAVDEAREHALPYIAVRHERNRGVSAARNSGLAALRGDLVGFLDGDDTFDVDLVAELSRLLEDKSVDIAVCRTRLVSAGQTGIAGRVAEDPGCLPELDGDQYARLLLSDAEKGFVTNKLYRRELLGDAPFPEGRVYEDFQVSLAAAFAANRIAVSDRALYYYTLDDSTISQRFGPHLADLLDQLTDVRQILGDRAGFEVERRVHRVGGIALSLANMAFRARHHSDDPSVRALAIDLITRARGVVHMADIPRLALDGRFRLAGSAALLKLAPSVYGRVLTSR